MFDGQAFAFQNPVFWLCIMTIDFLIIKSVF